MLLGQQRQLRQRFGGPELRAKPLLRSEQPDIRSVYSIMRPPGHWNSQRHS